MLRIFPYFNGILRVIFLCYSFSITIAFQIFEKFFGKSKKLPKIRNKILFEPAHSLAAKIRNKEITSAEVVEAYISRIKEVHPFVNAVVQNRFTAALNEARAADELIRSGSKSSAELEKEQPFLGVPFTTKDSVAIKGLLLTAGVVSRKNTLAEEDATVVTLMKRAGAIPVVSTNVPEICLWVETWNKIYGITRNAYSWNRTPGGSSGGEGAIVSSAGSIFGIGTDLAGSIRLPAFFSGIFGHKPTTGVVSNEGFFPPIDAATNDYWCTGPLCRYATDLAPMLKVLAGPKVGQLHLDTPVDLSKIKIYYMLGDGGHNFVSPVSSELRQAIIKTCHHFELTYAIKAKKLHLKDFQNSMSIWCAKMLQAGGPSMSTQMADYKGDVNPFTEIIKCILQRSDHMTTIAAFALLEKLRFFQLPSTTKYYAEACSRLQRDLANILGENAILLYPPHPQVAPLHYETVAKPCNISYTGIFNVMGFPATVCPLGVNAKGLPLGVQVVAGHLNDRLGIAVAVELEKAFGGWRDPATV